MPVARIDGYEIHYKVSGDTAVLRPEGACNESRTEALASLANSELVRSKNLILDLSHAQYVESPGFRWIVREIRSLESAGRSLIVAGALPNVERAYKLLQLDRLAPLAQNVSDALDILGMKRRELIPA